MTVRRDFDAIGSNSVVDKLRFVQHPRFVSSDTTCTYLIILRRQLVEALLNDMVAVEVLDQNDDVKAKSDNDRMNLSIVSNISLRHDRKCSNGKR